MGKVRSMELPDKRNISRAKKVALFGVLTATALILSYIESVLILPVTLPGVKPGLSNITLLTAILVFDPVTALLFGFSKCFLALLFGGRLASLFFSLSGTFLSVLGMVLCRKSGRFSLFGISICGSVFHIWGQLFAAVIMTHTPSVFSLTPVLSGFAVISGIITALPLTFCMPVFQKYFHISYELPERLDRD